MPQVTISLKPSEKDALILLANQERRKLADQAALIIVSELQRRGLVDLLSASKLLDGEIIQEVENDQVKG